MTFHNVKSNPSYYVTKPLEDADTQKKYLIISSSQFINLAIFMKYFFEPISII